MKDFIVELCTFRKTVVQLIFLCAYLYIQMKAGPAGTIRAGPHRSGYILALDYSVYEQFNANIKKAYKGSFRETASRMHRTVMLSDQQQRGERTRTSTDVGSSFQSVKHSTASRCKG